MPPPAAPGTGLPNGVVTDGGGGGGDAGGSGAPGREVPTRAFVPPRSSYSVGRAGSLSLGRFHTEPPATNVVPPPPSRLTASVTPRPSRKSAASAMVTPSEPGCRP